MTNGGFRSHRPGAPAASGARPAAPSRSVPSDGNPSQTGPASLVARKHPIPQQPWLQPAWNPSIFGQDQPKKMQNAKKKAPPPPQDLMRHLWLEPTWKQHAALRPACGPWRNRSQLAGPQYLEPSRVSNQSGEISAAKKRKPH